MEIEFADRFRKWHSCDPPDLYQAPVMRELETMKERFAKLLLGEDMSGSGKGVCTAVTISNAITNLYATVFGQNLRTESEVRAVRNREESNVEERNELSFIGMRSYSRVHPEMSEPKQWSYF